MAPEQFRSASRSWQPTAETAVFTPSLFAGEGEERRKKTEAPPVLEHEREPLSRWRMPLPYQGSCDRRRTESRRRMK